MKFKKELNHLGLRVSIPYRLATNDERGACEYCPGHRVSIPYRLATNTNCYLLQAGEELVSIPYRLATNGF